MNKLLLMLGILFCLASCQENAKSVIKKTEGATFTIYTYDEFGSPAGGGSGFFIDANGTGITNYHVLDGTVKAIVKTADEKEYEIQSVIASDKRWDIVKFSIKTNGDTFKALKFAEKKMEKGDVVYNIGSPLGFEQTVSNGIVSSLRDDKQHGDIVQITAPISSGNSGSPILNNKGEVFAVATFLFRGGQNLNFGVLIDQAKIDNLKNLDFPKKNSKFGKSNFVVLNIPADDDASIMLNAIEFGNSSTTLYLSYTHLNMTSGNNYLIWNELGKKENGFTLDIFDTMKRYYLTSSTLGIDKEHATKIDMASTIPFKVYFPAIKKDINHISIYGCGKDDSRWRFKDIYLENYKGKPNVDYEKYSRYHALAYLKKGYVEEARGLLLDFVDSYPDDVIALNTLAILSYIDDNYGSAIDYLSEAIDTNPNDELAYVNRFVVYKDQENYSAALDDITKAINIVPDQADNLLHRALLYMEMKEWKKAKADLDKVLASKDYKRDVDIYLLRIRVHILLENWDAACRDIKIAFQLTDNKKLEGELRDLWRMFGCRN